jgi:hypothetical protein
MSAASRPVRGYRLLWLAACAALIAAFSAVGVGVAWHASPAAGIALTAGIPVVAVLVASWRIGRRRGGRSRLARWVGKHWGSPRARFDVLAGALAYADWGVVPVRPPDDACLLTDEELCAAWDASTSALHERSPQRRRDVVAQRQRYLDEFDRRNPTGLKAWLAARDATSVDPRTVLVDGCSVAPSVDWDELTRESGA